VESEKFLPTLYLCAPLLQVLNDDLNTSLALTHLHTLAGLANKAAGFREKTRLCQLLKVCGQFLGFFGRSPQAWLQKSWLFHSLGDEAVEALLERRRQARLDQDYIEADCLRDQLQAERILLEDIEGKTLWRRQ